MSLGSVEIRKKSVSLRGMNLSRTAFRAIKRQVEQWIAREQTLLFLPKDAQYAVEIEGSARREEFNCVIQVRIGSREWKARQIGRTVKDAVEHSLSNLKFVHALA